MSPRRNNPAEHSETAGMTQARKALGLRKGKPTDADAPPSSLFRMTPAARAALALGKSDNRGRT